MTAIVFPHVYCNDGIITNLSGYGCIPGNLGLPEKYQPKGDYQQAGDYALQSEVNKKRDKTDVVFKLFAYQPYETELNSVWFFTNDGDGAWRQGLARNKDGVAGYSNVRSDHSGDIAHTNELLGFGQHWQNVAPQRQQGVVYHNTTGKPIVVCIGNLYQKVPQGEYAGFGFYVDDVRVASYGGNSVYWVDNLSVIVPSGSSYTLAADNGKIGFNDWAELRG
ncbi:hypothetical protein CKG00_13130 [Morganella morganii]|uniref:Uncharacterized protein n=1 Tax=Morganella morganii TaxID=582 RepID=A0A433ZYJ7_MORMO|nr:hypothetical protein [Morganella morganii]RUT67198.1 hypothetical protein CKG00_13130 [Morganella morganii]